MLKNEVYFEWVVEQVDEYGDIQDTYQVSSYSDAVAEETTYQVKQIALKRDKGNDDDGVVERGYAYIVDGNIEERFCSGQKVPVRYLKEIEGVLV